MLRLSLNYKTKTKAPDTEDRRQSLIRVEGLDWLRGMMAISIMLYHYTGWKICSHDSSDVLGRLGVYGVSTFFVLSGLSLAIVYGEYIDSFRSAADFYKRRIFRILPLMCLVTTFISVVERRSDFLIIFLNYSTLFGFIAPDKYIPTGAWSIGNEMVYYLFTPLIFFVFNNKKNFGILIFLITVIIALFFSFDFLKTSATLADQWTVYINPFNNFFLFTTGIYIYFNLKNVQINNYVLSAGILLIAAIFVLYPVSGNQINIVTGSNRLVFSMLSIFMVIIFWKMDPSFIPIIIRKNLNALGMATYSIYLLHPIVMRMNEEITFLNRYSIVVFSMLFSIILSVIVYKYFEKPFTKMGKSYIVTNLKNITSSELKAMTITIVFFLFIAFNLRN